MVSKISHGIKRDKLTIVLVFSSEIALDLKYSIEY